MCGQSRKEVGIDFENPPKTIKEMMEYVANAKAENGYGKTGKWIVQYNGPYIDTYCSKKCAE